MADSTHEHSDLDLRGDREAFTGGTRQSRRSPAGNDSPANLAGHSDRQVLLVMRLKPGPLEIPSQLLT